MIVKRKKDWLPSQFADKADFKFQGLEDAAALCHVRFYLNRATETCTAVVDEIDDENHGTSVTNSAANLAAALCDYYAINPECFALVEHYQPEQGEAGTFDDSYSRVNLTYDRARGFRFVNTSALTPAELADLTATPVEEWQTAKFNEEVEEVEA